MSNMSAAEALIYGPEWTFTNADLLLSYEYSEITRQGIIDEHLAKIDRHYSQLCRTLKCSYDQSKNTLTLQDGMMIEFTVDGGVIEIKASPQNLEQWKQRKAFIQEHIFEALAKMNLKPHEREGAGHLNIGLQYFEKRPLLFRNFTADFYNHPGLGTVLNSLEANNHDARYIADTMVNGQSPILLTSKNINQMMKNLEKIDEKPSLWSIDIYLKNVFSFAEQKTVALRIHKKFGLPTHWRFEVRTLRPQKSMQDFISAIEIFESRIQYLEKNFTQPISLLPPTKVTDGWKALGEFADYIDHTGLKWQNYRNLIPEVWRHLDEKNFIRGNNKPQMKARANLCQNIFR